MKLSDIPLARNVKTECPGPKALELMATGRFDMQSIYRSIVMDDAKSRGTYLVDVDDNVFLDLFGNFALGALGYNHPALLAVAQSAEFQGAAVNPTSTPFVTTSTWLKYVQELEQHFAPSHAKKVFCVDGGGEGVEAALKAAFIVHGEQRRERAGLPKNPLSLSEAEQREMLNNAGTDAVVVSFEGAFHGRGLGPLSATHSKVIHKADLPAFGWPSVPFPANRFPLARFAEHNTRLEDSCVVELERILDAHAGRVAAVLVEPIQSEGGDRHASPEFFKRVRALTTKAKAALIVDEVQTGVGVTGSMWAHEQLGVAPDLCAFGKKMQMGGFFATAEYDISQFGRMYQTRNGDRARAMLGLSILRTIASSKLLSHVQQTGKYFLTQLETLEARHPRLVSEPRGRGFLLAFDMPSAAVRDDFLKRTMRRGVLATYTGSRSVRLRPHLITTSSEVDEAIGVFDAVLGELAA